MTADTKANIVLDSSKIDLFSKEFIISFPKTVNAHGCWIPLQKPYSRGYVIIKIKGKRYNLHRMSVCIFNNLDYNDYTFEARHSEFCPRSCFNPEHLQPGSRKENSLDAIEHGRHINTNKDKCSRCGSVYVKYKLKSGPRKGASFRQCRNCTNKRRRKSGNICQK